MTLQQMNKKKSTVCEMSSAHTINQCKNKIRCQEQRKHKKVVTFSKDASIEHIIS